MRSLKLLVGLVLIAAMSPMTGRAAGPVTHVIEIRNIEFVPFAVAAQAGDIIHFIATGGSRCPAQRCVDHSVVSYPDATDFDSRDPANTRPTNNPDGTVTCDVYPCGGDTAGMIPYESFWIQYTGGLVTFRDGMNHDDSENPDHPNPAVPNSTFDAQGRCNGACGFITDSPPADLPQKPAITSPTPTDDIKTPVVTISGTAVNASYVVLRRKNPGSNTELVKVPTGAGGAWSTSLNFGSNGTYTIDAIGVHAQGYRSVAADPVTFKIAGADIYPPRIRLDRPMPGSIAGVPNIQTGRLDITGRVFDDVAVGSVTVTVHTVYPPGAPDQTPRVTLTGELTERLFSASLTPSSGWYTVTVTAVDASYKSDTSPGPDGTHAQPTSRDVIIAI